MSQALEEWRPEPGKRLLLKASKAWAQWVGKGSMRWDEKLFEDTESFQYLEWEVTVEWHGLISVF